MREQKSDWVLAACAVLGFALAASTMFAWLSARDAAANELARATAAARAEAAALEALAAAKSSSARAGSAEARAGSAPESAPVAPVAPEARGAEAPIVPPPASPAPTVQPAKPDPAPVARPGAEDLQAEIATLKVRLAEEETRRVAAEATATLERSRAAAAASAAASAAEAAEALPAGEDGVQAAALAALSAATGTDAAPVVERLGHAAVFAPAFARLLADPVHGARAVAVLAELDGVDFERFRAALAAAARQDDAFVAAAGAAWARVVVRNKVDAAAALFPTTADASPLPVRLAALVAAGVVGLPETAAWTAAAAGRSEAEAAYAIRSLSAGGLHGRATLLVAAASPRSGAAFRASAARALLTGAVGDDAAAVGVFAAETPGGPELLASPDVAAGYRPYLLAASVDRAALDPAAAAAAKRALGLPPGALLRELVARASADEFVALAFGPVARIRRPEPPVAPDDVRALLSDLRPADVRDVLDRIHLFDDVEAAGVAGLLAERGHPAGLELLFRAFGADAAAVRAAAAAAATRTPEATDRVVALYDDPVEDVRFAAAEALATSGLAVNPAVGVPRLADARQGGLAEPLLDAIARYSPPDASVALLLAALEAGAVRDPWPAARTVVRLALRRGFDYTAELVRHPSADVRAAAVEALGDLDAAQRDRAVGVFDRAAEDGDPFVRVFAAAALGRIPDELARIRVVQLVGDRSGFVREAAVRALGGHPPEHVVAVARRALSDPDPDVAFAARITLVRLGVVDEPARLFDGFDDPWRSVGARAALTSLVGPFVDRADAERLVAEKYGAPESRP